MHILKCSYYSDLDNQNLIFRLSQIHEAMNQLITDDDLNGACILCTNKRGNFINDTPNTMEYDKLY